MAVERLRKFNEAIFNVTAEMLLPNAVDQIARINPTRVYAEIPVSTSSFDAGFRTVTYKDLANAVNGVAWWIHNILGPSETCEPLCYMGPNDLTRNLVLLGCCKAGYSVSCVKLSCRVLRLIVQLFHLDAHDDPTIQCDCTRELHR